MAAPRSPAVVLLGGARIFLNELSWFREALEFLQVLELAGRPVALKAADGELQAASGKQ